EKRLFQTYDDQAINNNNPHEAFEEFLTEIGDQKGTNGRYYGGPTGISNPTASLFTEEQFIKFFAEDIAEGLKPGFTNLTTSAFIPEADFEINSAIRFVTKENLYWDQVNNKFYIETSTSGNDNKEYTETHYLYANNANTTVITSVQGFT